jgi:nucleoside-diphosphate-sugar epimerase
MKPTILITGATGSIGRALAAEKPDANLILFGHKPGDITEPHLGLSEEESDKLAEQVDVLVHAAADTRFAAPYETLYRTNVTGTRNVLEFASRCPRLRKFVHLSTTCIAGKREGAIPELPLEESSYVNAYEQTKHEAEQLVLDAKLPTQIVRLATVLGSECDGTVPRWGAAHMTLYFLYRGLIAMVPGSPKASLDFISSELAAKVVVAAALNPDVNHKILHVSNGTGAPLPEFVDYVADRFARRGFVKPPIVDVTTFQLFQESVRLSRDLLFNQVLGCTESFLPGLLHPKAYATRNAEALLGTRLPIGPWRELAGKVIDHCMATNWRRV